MKQKYRISIKTISHDGVKNYWIELISKRFTTIDTITIMITLRIFMDLGAGNLFDESRLSLDGAGQMNENFRTKRKS